MDELIEKCAIAMMDNSCRVTVEHARDVARAVIPIVLEAAAKVAGAAADQDDLNWLRGSYEQNSHLVENEFTFGSEEAAESQQERDRASQILDRVEAIAAAIRAMASGVGKG
jgi:hypothetical protein